MTGACDLSIVSLIPIPNQSIISYSAVQSISIFIVFAIMNVNTAEKAIGCSAHFIVPNPGFLMKKIPTWKLSVKDWDNEEFKTQVSQLFDQLNEVVLW